MVSLFPSVECRENCETSENYQLNVARHAFSCSMRFGSIWSVWCSSTRIMPSLYQALKCICFVWQSGFPTWAPNGVGIICTFFWVSSLSSLCAAFDVSHYAHVWHSIRIGVGGKGLVWWDVAILHAQCLLFFLNGVTLMTFPLVTMLQKGPFHLEQRIYDFILPGLWRSCCFCCL